jgi:hypothetical protein
VTGPDHYREAERLLTELVSINPGGGEMHRASEVALAAAQVHATLALAAASAVGTSAAESRAWADAAGTRPGGS